MSPLAADLDRFHLIDMHDAEDYDATHVAGTVHIPPNDLRGMLAMRLARGSGVDASTSLRQIVLIKSVW